MKILWFSNCPLLETNVSSSGTWLHTMSQALINNGVNLSNITISRNNNALLEEVNNGALSEFYLPQKNKYRDNAKSVEQIIEKVRPDIIHIWGLEFEWAQMYSDGYIRGAVLLEIQGLVFKCAEVCYAGLKGSELISCLGIKEILFYKKSLLYSKIRYLNKGKEEIKLLGKFNYISTQSEWVRQMIEPYVNRNVHIYKTGIIIRDEFINSSAWVLEKTDKRPTLFTIGGAAYKGLHMVIRAMQIIKERYPHVVLEIAGYYESDRPSWMQSGYIKYIKRLISSLGLDNNISFVGSLNAQQIVERLLNSRVFIQSSFVESYSLALAEAMAVGTPCVVANSGAMPELAKDGVSALFYCADNYEQMSDCIMRLLEDNDLSGLLSRNAIMIGRTRNNSENVVKTQLNIYKDFLLLR